MNALKVTLEVSFIRIYHAHFAPYATVGLFIIFSQFPLIFLHMYQRYKRRKNKISCIFSWCFEMEVIS